MSDPKASPPETEEIILGIPIEVSIVVGRCRPRVADLLALATDEVLVLDTSLSDPVELYVGDRLIARGELEDIGDAEKPVLAVRITSLHADGAAKT